MHGRSALHPEQATTSAKRQQSAVLHSVFAAGLFALLIRVSSTSVDAAEVLAQRVPDGGIQPQTAVDEHGRAHLLYFKGDPAGGDLFYTREQTAGALDWREPVRVNSQAGAAIALGTIRGGQLALGRDGRVHVVWNGSGKAEPKPSEGVPLLYARWGDDSSGFTEQRNLISTAVGLDGGASVAADTKGDVFAAWHARGAQPGEAFRTVYVAASADDGASFAPERRAVAAETGACSCCGLRASVDRNGDLRILYRTAAAVVPGGAPLHRDVYVLTSANRSSTFQLAPVQPWRADKCPMSSMSMAPFARAGVALAWENEGQVFVSSSSAPVEATPAPGNTGGRKHPVIALNAAGEMLLAWSEGAGWNRGGTFAWQIFDAQRQPIGAMGKGGSVATWSFVSAFSRPDGSFVLLH